MYARCFKRLLDIVLSGLGLILLTPLMLLVTVAIFCEDPGPVIFRQRRIGRNRTDFCLYKFRSMRQDAPPDVPTHLLKNPDRYLLRVGRFIRKASLDELPQLFNILKGDMSLVGPRPALWNQDDLIAEREMYGANALKPGLTGWAQINGRDELTIDQKAALDGEYAKRMNVAFDCKCIFGTIRSVIRREGICEGGASEPETVPKPTPATLTPTETRQA